MTKSIVAKRNAPKNERTVKKPETKPKIGTVHQKKGKPHCVFGGKSGQSGAFAAKKRRGVLPPRAHMARQHPWTKMKNTEESHAEKIKKNGECQPARRAKK